MYVKRLVRASGEAVFDIIEQQLGRLREVADGASRAVRIFGRRSPSPTLTEGRLPGRLIFPS